MNDFFNIKLKRAVWVAFLQQENLLEGIKWFEQYTSYLNNLLKNNEFKKKDISDEIAYSQNLFTELLLKLGEKFYHNKRYPEALICLLNYYNYYKNDVDIIVKLVDCIDNSNQLDLSQTLIKKLEEISKNNNNALEKLSSIYNNRGDTKKAIEYYEKYYLQKNKNLSAYEYNTYGCLYNKLYNETFNIEAVFKGLALFQKALQLDRLNKLYLRNTVIMASLANKKQLQDELWEKLVNNFELSDDEKFDYAAYCLKTENFENWYKYFDKRFTKKNDTVKIPHIPARQWFGNEDISNSTLLVYFEQGFGDTFWLAGYIPRLKKIAKKVIFVVQNLVADLIKNSNLGIDVYSENEINIEQLDFDYYIPSMSIPIALKLNRNNISVGGRYLKPHNELVEEYKRLFFNNDKLKVGICFSGSNIGNKIRDIDIKYFLPLDSIKEIEIYSLNKNTNEIDFNIFKKHKINSEISKFKNFEQTAAFIENLDLVITSDNVILNLAGALGKKTYAIFNWLYEYRWFDLTGENVIYYDSVKPFVNDKMNNWSYSINNVVKEIKKLIKQMIIEQ